MSLRFCRTVTMSNRYMNPNEGPKRGIGRGPGAHTINLPNKNVGPKKGAGTPPEPKPLAPKPIQPSRTVGTPHRIPPPVDLTLNPDGTFNFNVNSAGPQRGIGFGPGAMQFTGFFKPHEGPRKGIGIGPGTFVGASADDKLCVDLVNEFRKKNGLGPLQYSKVLSDIAMPHTQAMLAKKVPLGHDGFQERSRKVPYAQGTGENVGYEKGYQNPIKTLVDGWINSPPHRKNMLGNFNQIGVAFAHNGDLWYGTQFFAYI